MYYHLTPTAGTAGTHAIALRVLQYMDYGISYVCWHGSHGGQVLYLLLRDMVSYAFMETSTIQLGDDDVPVPIHHDHSISTSLVN